MTPTFREPSLPSRLHEATEIEFRQRPNENKRLELAALTDVAVAT